MHMNFLKSILQRPPHIKLQCKLLVLTKVDKALCRLQYLSWKHIYRNTAGKVWIVDFLIPAGI